MAFATRLPLLLAAVIAFAGCETDPGRKEVLTEMETIVKESAENNQAQASGAVPGSVSQALIPTIRLGSSELPEIQDDQRFDISVNNVPADQFFMSLVDGTSYNMVVHPEVKGNVTLNLRNVTVPQVMEAAREVYGYEFISTKYGFNVLPARLQARIYQINFLNISRSGSSSTRVSSGSLTEASGRDEGGDDQNFNDPESMDSQQRQSVTGTEIRTTLPETSFWQELQASVQAIVGGSEGRSVVVNPQSGVVVVRALPNELREVEAFLTATQLIVQRQVILEAKIIEVRLNDQFQSGINWAAMLEPNGKQIGIGHIGGGSVLVNETGVSDIAGDTFTLDPDEFPFVPAASSAFGGVFTLALELSDFTAFIELLKTQGNVQILSSPRVATMNNQKAVIKVGQDEFFVTDVSTTTVTGTTTTVQPNVTLTPFFSGIALDVTPQISDMGDVTLHIHPSISDVIDQQKTVVIGNVTQQLPLALSTVRETDSIVRAKSGQVVVLGGLMSEVTDDQQAATPGISEVPVVGELFKHTRNRTLKTELVILLRPIVVDDGENWTGAIQQSGESLRRLRETLNERGGSLLPGSSDDAPP